jgi:hypothetical protein
MSFSFKHGIESILLKQTMVLPAFMVQVNALEMCSSCVHQSINHLSTGGDSYNARTCKIARKLVNQKLQSTAHNLAVSIGMEKSVGVQVMMAEARVKKV